MEEEHEDMQEEAKMRKQQARALWRARQRSRSRSGVDDENSISLFDLFSEDRHEQRGDVLRRQIETACRAAKHASASHDGAEAETVVKSRGNASAVMSTWERRKICLEHVEKRRRTGVSIEKWSFASKALDRARQDAEVPGKKRTRRSTAAPVGGSTYTGPRTARLESSAPSYRQTVSPPKKHLADNCRAEKKGASLRQLFDVLGTCPTTDKS